MPGPVVPPEPRSGQPSRALLLGLLVLVLLLNSCTPAGSTAAPPEPGTSSPGGIAPSSPPTLGSSPSGENATNPTATSAAATSAYQGWPAGARATLTALAASARQHDRSAWMRQLSTRDPAIGVAGRRLYENLAALPLVALTLTPQPRTLELSPARRALLGDRAWVQQVAVSWRVTHDVGPAEQLLWVTFVDEGGAARVAGTSDGPPEPAATPLWTLGTLHAHTGRATTVLAAAGQSSESWVRRGDAAAAAVRRRLAANPLLTWSGGLVVELPATQQAFEQVLGVSPGSYAQLAAVAWPVGPDAATAGVRIVVNPAQSRLLDAEALDVLVTHEATHVATRSAASSGPTWLVEGFADYVAYDAHPRTSAAAARELLSRVSSQGPPARLPGDADFTPSAPELALTYAESWLACRFLAETYSPGQLTQLYARVDGGDGLAPSLQAVFDLTEAELTAGWQRYLVAAARRR